MHVLIINGSPRVKKYSNTDKILDSFTSGMKETGAGFTQYEVSDRKQWDEIRKKFSENKNILIALPLFVECIPGLLMEFLESLEPKNDGTKLAFILQSGFAEGVQLRCGEEFLKMLSERLGCEYCGTLIKGNNFSIRLFDGEQRDNMTAPYIEMGREYAQNGDMFSDKCRRFTGPEVFPFYVRILLGALMATFGRIGFNRFAKDWGCTKRLDFRPYT